MELNRNQYLMIGLVVLFLGIQFRLVDSVVLNAKTSEIIAKRLKKDDVVSSTFVPAFIGSAPSQPRRTVSPPKWLAYVLISVGAVTILHSLAMPRPG